MRDGLIELLIGAEAEVNKKLSGKSAKPLALEEWIGIYADHLIANGAILLPCKEGDILPYDGKDYKIDHWNVLATAFSEDKKLHLFGIKEAEKALKEKENEI